MDWPNLDWPNLDWPNLDWPNLVVAKIGRAKTTMAQNGLAQIGWPKRDWPKSVSSPESRPVSIQMFVRGESTVYCTTDLCLSVNKLKTEKREQCSCAEVSVYVVYLRSTLGTEDAHTPARSAVQKLSVVIRHSSFPGFTVQVSLRATAFSSRDLQCCLSCSRVQPKDIFL